MASDENEFEGVAHTRDGLIRLGTRLVDEEDKPDAALHCFETLLAQEPWDVVCLNNKAHCLRALHRVEEGQRSSALLETRERRTKFRCRLLQHPHLQPDRPPHHSPRQPRPHR